MINQPIQPLLVFASSRRGMFVFLVPLPKTVALACGSAGWQIGLALREPPVYLGDMQAKMFSRAALPAHHTSGFAKAANVSMTLVTNWSTFLMCNEQPGWPLRCLSA